MEPLLIYSAPPLHLTVSSRASPAAVSLLEQTRYGTHGPQYSHTGQARKVLHLTDPFFFDLWQGEYLVGTYCLSARRVQTPAGSVTGYYGRYLAVTAPQRGQGYGRLLKQEAVHYIERTQPEPHVFYSYIEAGNARSLRISAAAGFAPLAQFEALSFGRLYPRTDPCVRPLLPAEEPRLGELLTTAYHHHTLVPVDQLLAGPAYVVLEEQGQIVAGVRAYPTHWRIIQMPGVSGWALLHVLPHLPVLRRIINPQRYEFAALEALYVRPGHEAALLVLLESVLARLGVTSALLLLDVHDPLRSWLQASGRLGLLQALKPPVYTQVLAKLNGLTPGQVVGVPPQPLYASAFDFT